MPEAKNNVLLGIQKKCLSNRPRDLRMCRTGLFQLHLEKALLKKGFNEQKFEQCSSVYFSRFEERFLQRKFKSALKKFVVMVESRWRQPDSSILLLQSSTFHSCRYWRSAHKKWPLRHLDTTRINWLLKRNRRHYKVVLNRATF